MRFHPVVVLPPEVEVLDLSGPTLPAPSTPWAIGRYDEQRPAMYTQALFSAKRTLHVGLDLGGPVGVAVHAFDAGVILHRGYNAAPGDYGHVIVTEHVLDGAPLFVLHGHLSAHSIARWQPGDAFTRGTVLGWLGGESENGGWPPHLHLQLSRVRPDTHDMPGAVDPTEREAALARHPDPRIILGPVY
ncbi:MAG: peptidoglycan DD-metalloendopeptidase family protein [Myxococcota bacterium]|nr:peptidoglycan DD-metalloendopeptidase family protein [Myxococcota bacterium]